jgi:PAS domain S-box-containing protein
MKQSSPKMTRTERILEETVQKWDSLVHSTPDTIMILDSTGGITFANRAWLGRPTTGLVGNELFGFLPAAQQRRVRQCVVRVTSEGTTESCDIQLYNRKGKPWFNLRFAPVHSNASKTSIPHQTVCLLIRDITHEKRAEIEFQRTTQMLREFSARSDEIRERERAHIAREIHDELGQTLTALKMDLSWLKNHLGTPSPQIEERTRDMDETLDSMVHTVRRISSELMPALLDLGLVPAVEWQLEQFQKRSGIRTQVRIQPTEVDLNKRTATAVFRVVQEALTNIARHADANAVDFSMDLCDGELQLSILDNGRGITREQIKSLSSFGLTGMRERIHHIGGILEIEQMTTGGTCVSVRLPIERLSDQSRERNKL